VVKIHVVFSSFLTIPNAFKQCTIPLLIIHSAIPKVFFKKTPRLLNYFSFYGKIFFTTKRTKDTKGFFCLLANFILCDLCILRGLITVWFSDRPGFSLRSTRFIRLGLSNIRKVGFRQELPFRTFFNFPLARRIKKIYILHKLISKTVFCIRKYHEFSPGTFKKIT